MNSMSIRNLKLKYYLIMYYWNNKENAYFIVSTDETTALKNLFMQSLNVGVVLKKDDILDIKEIEIMHPN